MKSDGLSGQTAVVTGASSGIGRATALALATRGANIVVNYLNSAKEAESTAEDIRRTGAEALTVQADVRKLEDVGNLAASAKDSFGTIDILVNNAGIIIDKPVTFLKDEEWNAVVDTSLKGAFHCIKVIGRDMVRARRGRIINISSDAGLAGDVMRSAYSSAKAGLIGLTKATAREFASSGINVNAVAPGMIETDITAAMPEARRGVFIKMIPQHRFGTPREVAEVIAFLASEDSDYITGQVLSVDGGLLM